jgi:hypothetical protein
MINPPISLPDFVRSQLGPGEVVRWVGRPNDIALTLWRSWLALLLGIFWCAAIVTVFLIRRDIATDAVLSAAFALFAAFGLWLVTAPFREYWRAKRTVYAVTSERAVIFNGLILPTIMSIAPRDIGPIEIAPSLFGASSVSFTSGIVDGKARNSRDRIGSFAMLIEIALWLFGVSNASLTGGGGGKTRDGIGFFALADAKGAENALIALKGNGQYP